jgi:hypothetical protein
MSMLVSALLEDEEVLTELGTEFARVYATSVFRRIVQAVRLETINEPEPLVANAGRDLAMFLGEKGVFHDPEAPGEYEGVMYATTYRALNAIESAIQVVTSEALADEYLARDKEFVSSLALNLGRRSTQMLAEVAHTANGAAALAAGGLSDKPETSCLDWSARGMVHAELGQLLAPLGPRLLDYMGEATHSARGRSLRSLSPRSMNWILRRMISVHAKFCAIKKTVLVITYDRERSSPCSTYASIRSFLSMLNRRLCRS